MMKILPASIRSLESIVRLSYAYAKLRMSRVVEIQDAVHALDIYLESFYGGYEQVSDVFFEGLEQFLSQGRDRMKKVVPKKEESQNFMSDKVRTKVDAGLEVNSEEVKSRRIL